jgi:hypothetical protein
MAGFVANTFSTPLDVIERWAPDKLMAYFEKAVELRKLLQRD